MKSIVVIIGIATALSFIDGQECSQSDACLNVGGKCYSAASNQECPTGTVKDTTLCSFTGDLSCFCCKPVVDTPCFQTERCLTKKGRCLSKDKCLEKFGAGNFLWEPTLCKNEGTAEPNCGCCTALKTEKPTIEGQTEAPTVEKPCLQTTACKKSGGKCQSKDECFERFGEFMSWNPQLCKNDPNNPDPKCGCCKGLPTKKPTPEPKPCEQTDKCSASSGKCISREACNDLGKEFVWNPLLCKSPTNSGNCGCCLKATPKPTPKKECKKQDPKCTRARGFCRSGDQTCPANFIVDTSLCGPDPFFATLDDCFCCKPGCKPDTSCKALPNGKCVAKREDCPSTMQFDPTKCRVDPNGDVTCGCCFGTLPTKSPVPDVPCAQDNVCTNLNGFCLPATAKGQCNLETHEWRPTLCGRSDACACCHPKPATKSPTPPATCGQDTVCTSMKGFCLPASAKGQCNLATHEWRPTLCGQSDECACCHPKPE